VFISLFPTVVSINPLWQEILFGSIFLFVIVFFPEGFVGLLARAGRWLRAKWRPQRGGGLPLTAGTRNADGWVPAGNGASATKVAVMVDGHADGPTAAQLPRVALEARGITFSYTKGVKALDNVDFVVERGTIHGLIGPNGSGKSTLVNLLSGELSPQQGTISVNGERIEKKPAWQRPGLGLMRTFQTAGMVKELTTRDNVALGLFSQFRFIEARSVIWPMLPGARRDSRRMTAVASTSLSAVGLGEPWSSSRLADVPHGIEQLTQLAAACASQPSILVLDEPLAGLSAGEVDEVATIARRLKAQGVTIIVVEHQTRFIFEVCDAVTVLAAGELVKVGSAAEVRSDDRVREVYLGL
jgi:branched-chain amino acid transport system permease protein